MYDLPSNFTDCKPGWSVNLYGAEQAIPEVCALCWSSSYQALAEARMLVWKSQRPDPKSLVKACPLQAFLRSSYLVSDPGAADLFLVPAVMYCLTDGRVMNFTGDSSVCWTSCSHAT